MPSVFNAANAVAVVDMLTTFELSWLDTEEESPPYTMFPHVDTAPLLFTPANADVARFVKHDAKSKQRVVRVKSNNKDSLIAYIYR